MRLDTRLERLEAATKAEVLARSLEVVAHAFDHLSNAEMDALLGTCDLDTKSQRPPETWTPEQTAAVVKCQQGRDEEALVDALNSIAWAVGVDDADSLVDTLVELLDAHPLGTHFCRLDQQGAAPGGRT